MAEVTLWTSVPVAVIVDTETERVLRVVVIDKQVSGLYEADAYGKERYGPDDRVPSEERDAAIGLAARLCWPIWDIGW